MLYSAVASWNGKFHLSPHENIFTIARMKTFIICIMYAEVGQGFFELSTSNVMQAQWLIKRDKTIKATNSGKPCKHMPTTISLKVQRDILLAQVLFLVQRTYLVKCFLQIRFWTYPRRNRITEEYKILKYRRKEIVNITEHWDNLKGAFSVRFCAN